MGRWMRVLAASLLYACGGTENATPVVPVTPVATVPAAPLIDTATAGDEQVGIGFSAPGSDGGAAITAYRAACVTGNTTFIATATASPVLFMGLSNGEAYSCTVVAINAVGASAASASVIVTPVAPPGTPGVGTSDVLCGLSGSEYNADESVRLTATFSWVCGARTRVLSSNGLPNHEVGTFPNAGNPNPIAAVATTAIYTLVPGARPNPTAVVTSGYALNGVKLEPGTTGTCANAGGATCNQDGGHAAWNIEALGQSVFNFGIDENNGHVEPNGAYHYHGVPERLLTKLSQGTATLTLIGWAPDGFPIYARYGYVNAHDATSGVKVLRSSYRFTATVSARRPATATYPLGTFRQDYEYVAGSGDLDECNGRTGVTPEFPLGSYHYMMTDTYPFIGRCVKGTAASIR